MKFNFIKGYAFIILNGLLVLSASSAKAQLSTSELTRFIYSNLENCNKDLILLDLDLNNYLVSKCNDDGWKNSIMRHYSNYPTSSCFKITSSSHFVHNKIPDIISSSSQNPVRCQQLIRDMKKEINDTISAINEQLKPSSPLSKAREYLGLTRPMPVPASPKNEASGHQ
jgi:hypothetical protein